jgi:UDP-N-acetylmuramate--alanine ligase
MQAIIQRHYHLVGVGGVGMSALAQVLLAQGHAVSGSDRYLDEGQELDVFRKLKLAGIEFSRQDGSGVTVDTAGVIVSTAIEDGNPDVVAARKNNIPIIHRADMIAFLACGFRFIAVTGTSGKTTVTGMIGWVLECLGKDPTVVNGGPVLNWKSPYRVGNVRIGRSPLWIVEADESDRSLLRFEPDWVVVTNISKDHFEVAEVHALFQTFARRVRVGVVCGPGVGEVLRAGVEPFKPSVVLVEEPFEPHEQEGVYGFWYKGLWFRSPLIGRHNAENAFAAVVLCDQLGLDLGAVRNALNSFRGIERRLELAGEAHGVTVVDDYAHNPAKIRAALEAVRQTCRRMFAVWRPHGFGPLAAMRAELAEAFAEGCRPEDHVFILPVYYAGGSAKRSVTSENFVEDLREKGLNAEFAEDYDVLLARLAGECRSGDCVLCMGARDPELPVFARRVAEGL